MVPPTDEQLAPLVAEAERLHGHGGWSRIHEIEVVAPGEIPNLPPPPGDAGADSAAAVPPFGVSGTGTVTPGG